MYDKNVLKISIHRFVTNRNKNAQIDFDNLANCVEVVGL